MTTLFDIYDAAFDSSANPETLDLSTFDKIKDYIREYAKGGMGVELTEGEVKKIATVYAEYENSEFNRDYQNQFYHAVEVPLDVPIKNQ